MDTGLFELKNARDMFSEIQTAICEYDKEPNSRLFLFLVFSLNHLLEWIVESSYESIKAKKKAGREISRAEEFCLSMRELQEFDIVRCLCNRSKHYKIRCSNKISTSITEGAHCNSSCNDSLGQTYYLIDEIDSRCIFFTVYREYYIWFENND
jgi:hypothetical protein